MTLVLAALCALAVATPAWAADTDAHTIKITNTDQNVAHTYAAYKVFSGSLDSDESVLSNIQWAEGVNSTTLLAALKNTDDAALLDDDEASIFAECKTAQDVARVIAELNGTAGADQDASALDAVATIIADNLGTKAADFSADPDDTTGKTYKASVTGDGYYFIKDTTSNLTAESGTGSDTLSKYLLSVVKDTTIEAKDTGIAPDKKINDNNVKVKAGDSAIGDTVNFEVTVVVPNTKKYEDHFWFVMNDTLPDGITFTGITSVDIDGTTLTDTAKATPAPDLSDANYNATAGYYTLKVDNAVPAVTEGKYAFEATDYDAVAAEGGQTIELTFNQFKKFVETKNLIGKTVTVKYTGVVNDDAEYEATANENEVTFTYSNDPNYDYDGDNPGPNDDDVTGTTPESKTRTYTTSLKIMKVDEDGEPLAGATFELKGDALNRTVLTGTMFVKDSEATDATKTNGGTVDTSTNYWLLKDGSYTTTDPDDVTNTTQYASTDQVYYKVTYSTAEVATKTTDLVVTTDEHGIAEFIGIQQGSYTLEEVAAPEGYNKIDGKATITVAWSDPEATDAVAPGKDQGGFTLEATAENDLKNIAWNGTDKQFEIEVVNQSGSTLPSTGGMGTTILYTVGGILIAAGGIWLVTKKRLSAME